MGRKSKGARKKENRAASANRPPAEPPKAGKKAAAPAAPLEPPPTLLRVEGVVVQAERVLSTIASGRLAGDGDVDEVCRRGDTDEEGELQQQGGGHRERGRIKLSTNQKGWLPTKIPTPGETFMHARRGRSPRNRE